MKNLKEGKLTLDKIKEVQTAIESDPCPSKVSRFIRSELLTIQAILEGDHPDLSALNGQQ
jgi:hypothetical protein